MAVEVDFTKTFDKQFQKLPSKQQRQARAAIALFLEDTTAPALRNHGLKGEWRGYRSITAGGDLRLHFEVIAINRVLFVAVGSHSRLYR